MRISGWQRRDGTRAVVVRALVSGEWKVLKVCWDPFAGNTVAHSIRLSNWQPRLKKLDRSAALEFYIEAEFLQPTLDLARVRSVSKHPRTTAHRDQDILARTSTGNT
jgi:hypothetical protein